MNNKKLLKSSVILVVLLILFLPMLLAARTSPGAIASSSPTAPATVSQPLYPCSNPQQCREIDEVWQRIGVNVRKSEEIWDNSKVTFAWKVFTLVYLPPASSTVQPQLQPGAVNLPNLCFPIEKDSFQLNRDNFGDDRDDGRRCHAGIDLFTQGDARIVAVDDGTVLNIHRFVNDCGSGPGDALLIYHPNILGGVTINYGEMNRENIIVKNGETIKKGQYLGIAKTCTAGGNTMLHLEMYQGRISQTQQWNQNLPGLVVNPNQCALEPEFLAVKPSQLLDPTAFIAGITGNFCDGNSLTSR